MQGIGSLLSVIAMASIAAALPLPVGSTNSPALLSDPIAKAVRRADCPKAVQELNSEVTSKNNATALFIAGRMLDEGICVKKDSSLATEYFARSAEVGDQSAAIDYAAKIGLGEGTAQDYLRAGDVCHKRGGIDVQGRLSFYSLGYACTLSGAASRTLRESLPKGAFRLPTAPAIVEFAPGSSQMRIVSAPEALRGDAPTGSLRSETLVNPREAIEKAWREAIASAPKPDPANLGAEVVRLPIDLDTTLEGGALNGETRVDQMLPGDLLLHVPLPGSSPH
jgi:hypothetical protein